MTYTLESSNTRISITCGRITLKWRQHLIHFYDHARVTNEALHNTHTPTKWLGRNNHQQVTRRIRHTADRAMGRRLYKVRFADSVSRGSLSERTDSGKRIAQQHSQTRPMGLRHQPDYSERRHGMQDELIHRAFLKQCWLVAASQSTWHQTSEYYWITVFQILSRDWQCEKVPTLRFRIEW